MNLPRLGAIGSVMESLCPLGYAAVDGVTYPARTQGEELGADWCVAVIGHDGDRLVVRAATDAEARQAARAAPRGDLPPPTSLSGTGERSCADCGGVVHEIKLIDRGRGPYHHESILYTVPEARRSLWTGVFPVEGRLVAYMCQGCARVFLYGAPPENH